MKTLFNRFAPGLLALAIAAGGGVALTTFAQAQTAAPAPAGAPPMPRHPSMWPDEHGMWGGRGMHDGHMMRELERLKTSLKLNASQTALWDKAQEQMKPPTDTREKMMATRDRIAAMLDDPSFDPRKLAADMDSAQAERKAKMTAMRDAWFAVYDSLDPVQRGQAREFLRSNMAKRHGMGDRGERGGRGEWMHRHDGEPGKGPGASMPR
ncbi:MAG: periplasmic heavy metal sensor [Burkholderiaceae bacterium]